MTDANAQANIARLLQPSDSAGEFCFYAGSAFADAAMGRLTQQGNELRFTATYVKATHYGSSPGGAGTTVTKTEDHALGQFLLDLAHVHEIRLVDVGRDNRVCHWQHGKGKLAIVTATDDVSAMINVSDADVDILMASLTHLAPSAVLKSGRGA